MATWVGTQVATAIKNDGVTEAAKRISSVAVGLHLVEAAYWFMWGGVASAFGTLVTGAAGVYLSTYLAGRRAKRPDALAEAGSRVAYFLVHGVKPYLAQYSTGAMEARDGFRTKRLNFDELLLLHLRRPVVAGGISIQEFRDACEQLGALMLTLLFEPSGILTDFRLAVYRLTADEKHLALLVAVDLGDWRAHGPEPLEKDGSFLGAALDEGQPLVYPRDKKKRRFQERGRSRWKSFLVMPIPCDASVKRWGGVTVDYTGNPDVFTRERVEAVRDYARLVEMLYSLKKEGET